MSLADFSLHLAGTDTVVKPSRATAIAAKLPQQSVSSGEVVVTPSAEAIVGPHSLHTEAEVAVDGLSGVPHPVNERERAVAEAQLTDKGLPEGKVSSAVAGYLYFSIVPKKKQSVLQLDYEQNGTKVVLTFLKNRLGPDKRGANRKSADPAIPRNQGFFGHPSAGKVSVISLGPVSLPSTTPTGVFDSLLVAEQ